MFKNILNYIPSVAIPMMINVCLMYYNAKLLSPSEYGLLNIYMNTISLVYAFTLSFLQTAAFRFYSSKDVVKNIQEYFSTYILSNVLITLMLSIILFFISLIYEELNIKIVVLSVLMNGLYNFFLNIKRLENESGKYTFLIMGSAVINILIYTVSVIYLNKFSYLNPIYSMYLGYTVIVLIELFRYRDKMHFRFFSGKLLKKSLQYGFPMIGVSVMNLALTSSDQYLILYFLNQKAVGYYSIGYKISDTIIINISMVILLVMYPALMKLYDNGKIESTSKEISKMINLNFWIVIPVLTFLFIDIDDIFKYVFPEYIGSEVIARNVLFVALFHSLSMFVSKGLELGKKTNTLFHCLIITVLVNFLYNIFFIPIYGVIAAAHGSIVGYLIYIILLTVKSRKYIDIKFDVRYLLKVIFITLLCVTIMLSLRFFWTVDSLRILIFQLVFAMIIYFILTYIFKMTKEYK